MNFGLENAIKGLPALAGVVLGIYVFAHGQDWNIACAVALAVLAAIMGVGQVMMRTRPLIARWLIETWILSAVCVIALATSLVLWLNQRQLPLLPGVDKDTLATIATTFTGAVTTYVALIWTTDDFLPSMAFKSAMGRAFDQLASKPPDTSAAYDAIHRDAVRGFEGTLGWGFDARGKRAELLRQFLKQTNQGG